MSVSPQYEEYSRTVRAAQVSAQSIVECRLSDWSDNQILAVSPTVVPSAAEPLSGEVRYGGKLYFSVVARTADGTVIGAERGAEFSHRVACDAAAPAQTAEAALAVVKVEVRRDGRAVVLSAIVAADIDLYAPSPLCYLAGGEGVVCDLQPVRVCRAALCAGTAEIEEEFDTDYVGDVLLHGEQIGLTRVVASAGCLEVSGEINLCVLSKREGENDVVSYERMIPFRAEIACDDAIAGAACDARVSVSEVRLSAACDEDKGRCRLLAEIVLDIRGKVWRSEEIRAAVDAFCPGYAARVRRTVWKTEEPLCAFTATERVSGTAALDGSVDFACTLQATALSGVEAAAEVADGEVRVEGVLNTVVFYRDGSGAAQSARVSLPFSFPVRSDRARAGDRAVVRALACGVSARPKRAGELEAEGTVKLYIALLGETQGGCVSEFEAGEALPPPRAALGVYLASPGDTLWDTAKKLGKAPEQVRSENPDLAFPLTGKERIVVYRRREIG